MTGRIDGNPPKEFGEPTDSDGRLITDVLTAEKRPELRKVYVRASKATPGSVRIFSGTTSLHWERPADYPREIKVELPSERRTQLEPERTIFGGPITPSLCCVPCSPCCWYRCDCCCGCCCNCCCPCYCCDCWEETPCMSCVRRTETWGSASVVSNGPARQGNVTGVRRWTDNSGRFHAEARLFSFDGKRARSTLRNGTWVSIAIERLSKGDQYLVRESTLALCCIEVNVLLYLHHELVGEEHGSVNVHDGACVDQNFRGSRSLIASARELGRSS